MAKNEFFQKVWKLLRKIPRGKVTTYKLLAKAAGNSKAARAVANACASNKNAPKVPCHRVVCSCSKLGGYSAKGGVARKAALLRSEGLKIEKGRVVNFEKRLYKF